MKPSQYSSSYEFTMHSGCVNDIMICRKNLYIENSGKITIIRNDLIYAVRFHGFEDEEIISVNFFGFQALQRRMC